MGIFGKELVIKLAIIHILFIRTFNGFPHLSSSPLNEEKLSFHDENKEHRPTDEADKVSGKLLVSLIDLQMHNCSPNCLSE